ncbi:MAG: hypothetical protein U0412_05175 [Nitrospira sp.]
MKLLVYGALILLLVAVHVTLLPSVSVWGVTPDVGLVAVCFVGLLAGEFDGLLVGLILGWAMSLFSAQDLATSILVKGGVGFLAGLAGRQITHVTPPILVGGLIVTSMLAGVIVLWSMKPNDQQDLWWALRTIILPQACFDAVIGGLSYWLIWSRFNLDRLADGVE